MKHFNFTYFCLAFIAVVLMASCSKMDDAHKQFLGDGLKFYVGKPTNVEVAPGRNRIKIAWPTPSDPNIINTRIYWNNFADSIDVPTVDSDTLSVVLNSMSEGVHNFTLKTFDNQGNVSLPMTFNGQVFGTIYESMMLSRPILNAVKENNLLKIGWGGLSDTAIIGTELKYTDDNNVEHFMFVPKEEKVTEVPIPFERGDLIYRTVYVPVVNGLDTFYTVYTTHYVKGAPIDLSRASWTIHSYSSHDTRGGASFRPPSNLLLDNNALWVNYIAGGPADPNASIPTGPGAPAPNYPHWAVIDMQEVKNGIEGFYIVQRWDPTGRLRTVRMYGSVDGVAFTEFGVYTLANVGGGTNGIAGKIYLDIEEPVNIRYFKLEGLSDHNNSANISLAGVGAFTR